MNLYYINESLRYGLTLRHTSARFTDKINLILIK